MDIKIRTNLYIGIVAVLALLALFSPPLLNVFFLSLLVSSLPILILCGGIVLWDWFNI